MEFEVELKMDLMVDLIGYIAASLVFATFYVKNMLNLRLIAISSNIAFICYGLGGHLQPIFILHSLLLPLNLYRIFEMKKGINDFSRSRNSGMKATR